MNNITENISCLACGSPNLQPSLDLGIQPLANSYLGESSEVEDKYPLGVNLCRDCCHLQLTHTVDPALIYKNYLYVSGTSKTLKDNMDWFARYVNETVTKKTNRVLDIGCNDGTQLNFFKNLDYQTWGVDPAENIYPTSSKEHTVICDFFSPDIIDKISVEFDAITAQNVVAHNPNPLAFLQTCQKIMSDHTLLFVQTSQADMILNDEFDTIYHEHVNFFNANSMSKLANRAGLFLIDVQKTPIHGNSYIFVFSKTYQRAYHLQNIIDLERAYGLLSVDTYTQWVKTVTDNVQTLVSTLDQFKQQGYVLVGYGAAAKGMTLLNFGNIKLDFVIDDNPMKQGLYTPGTGCPIVSVAELTKYNKQDKMLFVPLAWNFFSEIKNKIQSVRSNINDKFIKYFPEVEVH
jgi:SAM-dependent methyltransferase